MVKLERCEHDLVTSSRRKARKEMTVSTCVAPGLAVTQQMAMETDIIIRTVFRIAASVHPDHIKSCMNLGPNNLDKNVKLF